MNTKIIRQRKDSIIKVMHIESDLFDLINTSNDYEIIQLVYIGDGLEKNLFVEYIKK